MPSPEKIDTHHKALTLNLDPSTFGSFAEIGAGQEVARWFLIVGGASATAAKTISAYNKEVSDDRIVVRRLGRRCPKRTNRNRFHSFSWPCVCRLGSRYAHGMHRIRGTRRGCVLFLQRRQRPSHRGPVQESYCACAGLLRSRRSRSWPDSCPIAGKRRSGASQRIGRNQLRTTWHLLPHGGSA